MSPLTDDLNARCQALGLYGVVAHWDEIEPDAPWLRQLVEWEEAERARRSLERRIRMARIGTFKSIADFDWTWPKRCDRTAIQELLELRFMTDTANAILLGPNGVGKSTIAQNVAHQALLAGHNVRFVTASEMLNELASQDGASALRRKLARYVQPQLLIIDELGYLSYSNRHADLLFEVVSRRYGTRSTLVTTNKPFAEWADVFPNATCVVTLVDRLVHRCDIVTIDGDSYRLKEAKERTARLKAERAASKPKTS